MAMYEMPKYKAELLNRPDCAKERIAPKHVKVTLDFVSVDDELPDDDAFYVVLEYDQWVWDMWAKFCWEDDEWRDRNGNLVDVTHWADIPDIDLTNAEE